MPVRENNGLESKVTGHPRRSQYFMVAEVNGNDVSKHNRKSLQRGKFSC